MNSITLEKYEQTLKEHDWYYMMSDSSYVYSRGRANYERLNAIRKQSKAHDELYLKYYNEKFPTTEGGHNNG